MRLVSFLNGTGRPSVGVAVDGGVVDLTDVLAPVIGDGGSHAVSPMRRLLMATGGELSALSEALPAGPVAAWSEITLQPPVPDPTKIVAAPVNYVDHQREMGQTVDVGSLGVFLKAPSSLLAHEGTVRLPYTDRRFDQEGELGLVIGRAASHVSAAEALDHVAGLTCLLDMTMRGGEDRSVRKSFDTFTPCGPYLVTPDEVGPIADLELHTWVGGTLRQRADLKGLIWDVPALIEYISSVMHLLPGDVIATGTPAGVGPVHDGQDVTVEITNVGRLTVRCSGAGAVTCPTQGRDRGPRPPSAQTPVNERVAP